MEFSQLSIRSSLCQAEKKKPVKPTNEIETETRKKINQFYQQQLQRIQLIGKKSIEFPPSTDAEGMR